VHLSICAPGSWLTVYSTPSGVRLSDVFVADSDTYPDQEVGLVRDDEGKLDLRCRKNGPSNAFVIHEDCWPSLVDHLGDETIDLDGLFEKCKDIPRWEVWGAFKHRGSPGTRTTLKIMGCTYSVVNTLSSKPPFNTTSDPRPWIDRKTVSGKMQRNN